MGIVVVPTYGSDPATITAANLDAKVAGLATEFNGSTDNDNIKAAAGIVASKLDLSAIAQSIAMTSKDISEAKGANVASATTTEIWVADGNFIHISGTTTITSLGTAQQAGDERTIVFDGILTLTHNSTSLILPGAANITTAAGDRAIVRAETTANARVICYTKADGTAVVVNSFTPSASNALTGSVVQVVNTSTTAVATGTTVMPIDDTIPQNNEGDEYLTRAITPNASGNKLRIDVTFVGESSAANPKFGIAIFQDSTANGLKGVAVEVGTNELFTITFSHFMDAGTTSATTFKVRAGASGAGTTTFNGEASSRIFGGVCGSSITITEIKG